MDCPSCAAANPDDKNFCRECGSPLPRCCPTCGHANPANNKFCGDCGAKLIGAPPDARPASPAHRTEAERRQLTVLFCDLVGSTELSARLDPEDMGQVIGAYQQCCAKVVKRWEGHIAKYMGDGILALFGYPRAHEDDAERAVRAGLELTAAVARLTADDAPLAARVGIATGQVVVGEIFGEGPAQEQPVVGETPNLAARLQALAEPGTVVVAAGTRRLLGDLFELEDLGPTRLKGFAEPVAAFRVVGEGHAQGRFEALRGQRLTPLVGREHELGLLLDRWELAKCGEGQVVLLSGEPGIGKSRLGQALLERIATEPHVRLRYYCSPYHANSALHPVIEQLQRAAGFAAEDDTDVRLDKLEAVLGQSSAQVAEVAPLLAALLSIPTDTRYPPLNLTPQAQKAKTFEALLAQLEGLAAARPTLMAFEDAHWIDPTSAELFGEVIDRVARLPVLLAITFRPEFKPPWSGQAHVTSLTLNRLSRRQGTAIIARLTGGKALPFEVMGQILAKTDGVPLFVEELTQMVLESGLLRDAGGHFELAGALPEFAIPATLSDSLMARLDRLAPVKEVAQTAAAIGREFSYKLLAAVSPLPEPRLNAALDQLARSEVIFCRGSPPEATYSFKHALVQDAAYQSLLRSRRQQLHARIATNLEEHFPEVLGTQPEIVAHQHTEAGFALRAVELWQLAGEREARRWAHLEAIAHFMKALSLMDDLPAGLERSRRDLELRLALGPALMAAEGMASDRVIETYRRARELGRDMDDPERTYTSTWGLWLSTQQRGLLGEARALAREVLTLAENSRRSDLLLQAHHAAWTTLFFQDDLSTCLKHTEQGRTLYDMATHRAHALRYGGHDPGVCACATGGLVLWLVGFPDHALTRVREAIELAERLDHPVSQSNAAFFASILHQYRREPSRVRAHLDALLVLCREKHIPHYEGSRTLIHGWVEAAEGHCEAGVAEARRGLELHLESPVGLRRPYYYCVFADTLARSGDFRSALGVIDEALGEPHGADDRHWEPELHRLRGEFLRYERAPDDAEVSCCFEQALAAARRQGAKSLELRAATSLARLRCDQGKRSEARDLLASVYGWFTEGFDTADLKDARALLAALG